MPKTQPIRLGILVDSLLSRYQVRLFNGAKRVARRMGARVIGFQGNYVTNPDAGAVFDGSFLYELAGPECVDGLLVATNVLASGVGPSAVAAFCQKSGLPVVSIGELDEFPHVEIDNRTGLSQLIEHLVSVHGRRRFAFIRGPYANPDSIEREQVFRATLDQLDLPFSEDWMLPGSFLEASGATAIRLLLDERRVSPDAIEGIIAANDQMAAGAVLELHRRGLRVPRDIAVVGFDDDDHARNTSPPLTTVAQPIERLAGRAVEILCDLIAGRVAPERTLMAAEPVWRRSCGCDHAHERVAKSADPSEPVARVLGRRRVACVERLERLVGKPADASGVDAMIEFIAAPADADVRETREAFEQALVETSEIGIDPLRWQDVMQPVDDAVERHLSSDGEVSALAQRRVEQVRLLINEVTARTRALEKLHTLQLANAERVLGSALACAKNFSSFARVLEAGLGRLGVRYACVCSFVGAEDPRMASVVALYDPIVPPSSDLFQSAEQLWRALPPTLPPSQTPPARDQSIFPARELVHGGEANSADIDLLVYPLVFAKDALGYVVFDSPHDLSRAWMLEGLAGHLSSAVYALARAEEIRRAREMAERASAAKSEFVAMMSHEVRTPLTAIIGHIDLCLQTPLNAEQLAQLNRARASSRALLGIVNDILDFSKIEAQKMALEAVPFELDEVLDQIIGTCAAPAAKKNLEFVLDVDSRVPQGLTGDPLRLTQVLLNLVGNAIKFSHKGYVALRVERLEDPESPDVALRFAVSDSGIGMTPEQLTRVFNPFTQADGSMTRRYGGTGLGLTISRRLVELMGGSLEAESELNRGSEFSFKCRFGAAKIKEPHVQDGAGLHVLVVEDNALQATALARALAARGYDVLCASSSACALALLEVSPRRPAFDFVLVDRTLPDGDGLDLIHRIAANAGAEPGTLLLLSDAAHDSRLRGEVGQRGLCGIIEKPFQRAVLARTLMRARQEAVSSQPPAVTWVPERRRSLAERCILVVQDEAVSRELTRQLLELEGAEVHVAVNGVDAIRQASSRTFDLILMDVHLPLLDGPAAARAIRNDPRSRHVPIVALSASARPADRSRCIESGMNAYVCMPIDRAELLRILCGCLNSLEGAMQQGAVAVYRGMIEAELDAAQDSDDALPQLDSARALARLGGDSALYQRLLRRFLQNGGGAASEIRRALAGGDVERARLLAHTVAASAANVGAEHLHRLAKEMEAHLLASNEPLGPLLVEFEDAENGALEAIVATLEERTPSSVRIRAVSTDALESTLQQLHELIIEHDTAALDSLETLRSFLDPLLPMNEALRALETSVTAYDFERALVDLEQLRATLAVREAQLSTGGE